VPTRKIKIPLVIVGGGVAGLSAAWWLDKHRFHDFVLLEMLDQAGGNARSGQDEVTPYPWAAHYVPVPGPRATLVRELFEELGVLKNGEWEERYLCFTPQERLFLYGRWQEGIEPGIGLTPGDREQFRWFFERMAEFHASGQFTIPMELGAKPSPLDRTSFAEWMRHERFDSPYLIWFANYCCRDDYGALAAETSAWAGVHYFASREPVEKGPLTWPEGNGWIVKRLLEKLGRYVTTGTMVHRITPEPSSFRVLAGDTEYTCDVVIFAAPTFLAPHVIDHASPVREFVYSPWLTANLTLDRLPAPRSPDLELTWDNVIYDSPTLGYVVATHQSLRTFVDHSVWTFYWALAEGSPSSNRELLLEKDWGYWKEAILNDLARAHPDIRSCVSRIDILRLGHAMIRPTVGFLSSEERQRLAKLDGRLLFANSDLSGLSLFEEAQYRGVKAADRALRLLGGQGASKFG
jgi:protoporphyrinogen oxidase